MVSPENMVRPLACTYSAFYICAVRSTIPLKNQGAAVTRLKLTTHVEQDRYGDFYLTDAVRPAPDLAVIPTEGYRVGIFRDPCSDNRIPMLVASVSREKLFDVFHDMIELLGDPVDVILETSHDSSTGEHHDLCRDGIDLPVLQSYLCDFEDLLLNDGCSGIAVMNEEGTCEVQFDEHKLIIVYSADLQPYMNVLARHGVRRDDRLKVITEAEHLHSTNQAYREQFHELCCRLGIAESIEHARW